jgi:hypothetical protein
MSVIVFSQTLKVSKSSWAQQRNDIAFNSSFGYQAVEASAPTWAVTLEAPAGREADGGAWQSLIMQLRGKTNQLALWNHARPVPRGTMRGTMTLNASVVQGATTLQIVATGENAKTLIQGDMLGIGSLLTQQVVMVVSDATSNGSGVINVTIEPALRNAFSSGESVTWNMPKALFRRVDSNSGWNYYGSVVEGFTMDLREDWR